MKTRRDTTREKNGVKRPYYLIAAELYLFTFNVQKHKQYEVKKFLADYFK
jgi:hypothetical protein